MTQGLTIGPGFQQWIADHQATPKSDERWISDEHSICLVAVADAAGQEQNVLLLYNKLTNETIPFEQADL